MMKKTFGLFFLATLLCLSSCTVEDSKPADYLSINGQEYSITSGSISDNGTNNDITYRSYFIKLYSGESSYNSENYIQFMIQSNDTQRLQEGTYQIVSTGADQGEVSYLEVGADIKYDDQSEAISGKKYPYANISDESGTVIVSQEDGDYKFEIDAKFSHSENEYEIKGFYWNTLVAN